ncbi:hypothetical protein RvY_02696 [Ramazzottius varieornatus]|uniref:Uncharacterized protein n=1 Tax=Ramazzottius varieornatus TaxID=947166 RepID=A0A1D1UKM1_RAMVA|nr:hypothetical protein RvY_02696 [Ramazzottius varieornatus]
MAPKMLWESLMQPILAMQMPFWKDAYLIEITLRKFWTDG